MSEQIIQATNWSLSDYVNKLPTENLRVSNKPTNDITYEISKSFISSPKVERKHFLLHLACLNQIFSNDK